MKKIVGIFIVLFCTTAANAQFSGGNGTESNPYIITTAAQLAQLVTYVNAGNEAFNSCYYELGSNIDLSNYQSGQGWNPIGSTNNNYFSGVFDGNNKKITGLKINTSSQFCVGLFGYVSDGTIKNLGIENANVSGRYAGIVAGYLYYSVVLNCYSTGTVNADSTSNEAVAGGFAGYIGDSTVSNCYSTGTVSANSTPNLAIAGSFAGDIYYSVVSNCYSTGTANANSTYYSAIAGGIAGEIYYSTLSNCYSTGKVSAKSVHSGSAAGGITGGCLVGSNISYCVAINPVVLCTGTVEGFGRVIGDKDYTCSSNSNLGFADMYNYYGNEWFNIGATNLDGETISKEQIMADGTLGNRFTAENGWTTQNGKLPGFGAPVELPDFMTEPTVVSITVSPAKVWMGQGTTQTFEANVFTLNNAPTTVTWSVDGGVSGTGITQNGVLTVANNETALSLTVVVTSTFDNTIMGTAIVYVSFVITTAEELAQVATYVNSGDLDFSSGYFILGNDIDLSIYQSGSGWTPIGDDENAFHGTFNGNNKKITGLKINTTALSYVGLFGYVNGTIKNLGIENADIYRGNTANNDLSYAGILAGSINNGVVLDCYATGTVSSNSIGVSRTAYAGGVAGIIYNNSTITNCYSAGTIYAYCTYYAEAGGLVGEMQYSTISNCYSMASVTAHANNYTCAGGVAGDLLHSTISNCYATGYVSTSNSNSRAGGVAGQLYISTVSNCAALNLGIISQGQYGRVVGSFEGYGAGTLISNIAFSDMLNPSGNTTWNNIGASNRDGESISCENIHADGTLGNRFTGENGWTTENDKLPGLFGNVVDFPNHLWCGYPVPPTIITTTFPNGTTGTFYNQTLTAIGTAPITWSLESGSLPNGLTLSSAGVISGIPTVANTFNFTVKATNSAGSNTKTLSITIVPAKIPPTITTTTLPDGVIGIAYYTLLTATGSTPFNWSVLYGGGNLPDGLILSVAGDIVGTPTVAGTFNFTVQVYNGVGTDTKALSITITTALIPPIITTTTLPDGIIGTTYSTQLAATGTTPITWSLESGSLPNGLTLSSAGVISGTPTEENTFNFTVKATNGAGTDTKEFSITIEKEVSIPNITQHNILKAYLQDGTLYVSGLQPGEKWSVYTISGICIYENTASCDVERWQDASSQFGTGIYIVKAGNRTIKALVHY